MKKKLCLGSAEPPIHPQHMQVMYDFENWQLVDQYINHPDVMNMDATTLEEVSDNYLEYIYASHLLEHISHRDIAAVLALWYTKLEQGGRLTINVPDLEWACRQVLKHENMQPLDSSVYTVFEGNNGLQSIFYGTHAHEGEYHKAGFTKTSLKRLLEDAGFKEINIEQIYEAHDMSCLIASCIK